MGEGDAVGGFQQIKDRTGQVAIREEGQALVKQVGVLGVILKDEMASILFVEEKFLYLLSICNTTLIYRLAILYRA